MAAATNRVDIVKMLLENKADASIHCAITTTEGSAKDSKVWRKWCAEKKLVSASGLRVVVECGGVRLREDGGKRQRVVSDGQRVRCL
eukprot:3590202-Rhodomonas_salina.1